MQVWEASSVYLYMFLHNTAFGLDPQRLRHWLCNSRRRRIGRFRAEHVTAASLPLQAEVPGFECQGLYPPRRDLEILSIEAFLQASVAEVVGDRHGG